MWSQFSCLCLPSCCMRAGIAGTGHHIWPFMCGLGSISGYQAYVTSAFYTESPPWPGLATLRLLRVCCLEHILIINKSMIRWRGEKGNPKRCPQKLLHPTILRMTSEWPGLCSQSENTSDKLAKYSECVLIAGSTQAPLHTDSNSTGIKITLIWRL